MMPKNTAWDPVPRTGLPSLHVVHAGSPGLDFLFFWRFARHCRPVRGKKSAPAGMGQPLTFMVMAGPAMIWILGRGMPDCLIWF